MIDLLKAQNWDGVKWVEPKGGMFIWVEMPQHIDTAELMKFAVEEGVAFVPGVSFYADEPQTNSMRLNFTHTDYEEMKTAFERLNRAIEKLQSVAVQP